MAPDSSCEHHVIEVIYKSAHCPCFFAIVGDLVSKMASAYSPEQIDLYEEYISLPSKYRRKNNPSPTIDYLTSLHIHQISAIPYENLLLHYSPAHSVS